MNSLLLFFISVVLSQSTMNVHVLNDGNILHHLSFQWKHGSQDELKYPDGLDLPSTYYLNKKYNISISEIIMTRGNWKSVYGKLPYAIASGSLIAIEAQNKIDEEEYYLSLSTLLQNTAYQGTKVQPQEILNKIHQMNVTNYIAAPSDWSCVENLIRIQSLMPHMKHSNFINNNILKNEFYSIKLRQEKDQLLVDLLVIVKNKIGKSHNVKDIYKTHCNGNITFIGFEGMKINDKEVTDIQSYECDKKMIMKYSNNNNNNQSVVYSRYSYVTKPSYKSISDGYLKYEMVNTKAETISTDMMISIPFFLNPKMLRCYINETEFDCNVKLPSKCEEKWKAISFQLSSSIPSFSTLRIEIDTSFVYQQAKLHSQEPQKGWDVPSVSCKLSNGEIIISNNLLVGLPAPDFSMPYNTIALTLAIMALGIGWVVDEVVQKRKYLLKNQVKTNLPTSVLLLTSLVKFIVKIFKRNKKENNEDNDENNNSDNNNDEKDEQKEKSD